MRGSTTSARCAPPTTGTCGSNQYTNPGNWKAHYRTTAPAIARQFPQLDVLFVGAGTTGTLMGCARYFREWHRPVRVVAVDSVGSVAFGGAPGRRMIPGLGTSIRPPLLDESYVDEVVRVEEADTIRACHRLARRGFLFGGSTGTVVSGAMGWLAQHDARELTAVAIAPDLGERYLDTIYQANWLRGLYGEDVLGSDELTAGFRQHEPRIDAAQARSSGACRISVEIADSWCKELTWRADIGRGHDSRSG